MPTHNQETVTNYMYLGLLPFFVGAFGPWIFSSYEDRLIGFFSFYSSLIFTFLAGSLWSIALQPRNPVSSQPSAIKSAQPTVLPPQKTTAKQGSNQSLHAAIVFSLWPLVCYLLPSFYGLILMLLGFLTLLFWEKRFINPFYSKWYASLRHKITFIVVACHMLTIWNLIRVN